MVKYYSSEKWKEFEFQDKRKARYAVSNFGRIITFKDKIIGGKLLKGSALEGYRLLSYKILEDDAIVNKYLFIHHIVADKFVKQPSKKHEFVIHLDFKRDNNKAENLKWVTKEQRTEHHKKSPHVLAGIKKVIAKKKLNDGKKLTIKNVVAIKKKLSNPKLKLSRRELAEQYGISEMQLYRIQSGENWGHIKVD